MIATVPADPQPRVDVATPQATLPPPERRETVFEIRGLTASYGATPALSDVGMQIYENLVVLKVSAEGAALLPKPGPSAGTMSVSPSDVADSNLRYGARKLWSRFRR